MQQPLHPDGDCRGRNANRCILLGPLLLGSQSTTSVIAVRMTRMRFGHHHHHHHHRIRQAPLLGEALLCSHQEAS
jgi:hypothetical protein